ncbi:hypothetical protein [Streptomyces sp. NPDC020681]|uniref:hypothetical protein n=1 Tax=Streptomyces sp. NPDC020681 TaxID=3365083 RepID=UPI0037B7845D
MRYVIDTNTQPYEQAALALRLAYGIEAGPQSTQPRPLYLGKLVLEPLPESRTASGPLSRSAADGVRS